MRMRERVENGRACIRAQQPGNVYRTCTFRRGRINSTVSRVDIHTKFAPCAACPTCFVSGRDSVYSHGINGSSSRFRTLFHVSLRSLPLLSFSLSVSLPVPLSFYPVRGWVRVIITFGIHEATTHRRTYSRFQAIHPFREVCSCTVSV